MTGMVDGVKQWYAAFASVPPSILKHEYTYDVLVYYYNDEIHGLIGAVGKTEGFCVWDPWFDSWHVKKKHHYISNKKKIIKKNTYFYIFKKKGFMILVTILIYIYLSENTDRER